MSTVTTIGVVDLLTIRECIEILVRQGEDGSRGRAPVVQNIFVQPEGP